MQRSMMNYGGAYGSSMAYGPMAMTRRMSMPGMGMGMGMAGGMGCMTPYMPPAYSMMGMSGGHYGGYGMGAGGFSAGYGGYPGSYGYM